MKPDSGIRPAALCLKSAALLALTISFARAQFHTPEPAPPFGDPIVSHRKSVSKSKPPMPGYLETITCKYFGAKITRVTKGNKTCRNRYMKHPPFNADATILELTNYEPTDYCKMFLDGETYEPRTDLHWPVSDTSMWHPQRPDIMVCLADDEISWFNVRTGENTVLGKFPEYKGLMYVGEGVISGNGRWVAPYALKDGKQVMFAFDMLERKKYPDIDLTGWIIDWVSIGYSGKYCLANSKAKNNPSNPDVTQVYDCLTGKPVGSKWPPKQPSHYDVGIDENGDDVAVGIAKGGSNRGKCIMKRLKDGKERALCPAQTHTGCRNSNRPGWAYLQGTKSGMYVNEVIAVQLTWDGTPIIERFAYIPYAHVKGSYQTEPYGAAYFAGTKFVAGSNWGNSSAPMLAYVVDWSHLVSYDPTSTAEQRREHMRPYRGNPWRDFSGFSLWSKSPAGGTVLVADMRGRILASIADPSRLPEVLGAKASTGVKILQVQSRTSSATGRAVKLK